MTDDTHGSRGAPPEFKHSPQPGDITPALRALLDGATLDIDQTQAAFEAIMSGNHPLHPLLPPSPGRACFFKNFKFNE